MDKIKINRNIAKILLIKILMVSTIATAFFTGISFYLEYNSELDDLDLTFEQISKTSIPGLEKSIYDIDEERINSQVNVFLQIRPFVRVVIKDERDTVISDMKETGVDQIDLISRNYKLYYWNGLKKVFLGKLIIYATQQFMYQRLKKKLIYFFFSQGLKTFLVSFIIMFIFNFYIVRHLNVITKFYQDLLQRHEQPNIGDHYKDIIVLNKPDTKNTDEIDFLVSTMNKMNLIVADIINSQKEDILNQREKALTNAKFAAIGELAAGVGHEINNPLTIAIGNLQNIKSDLKLKGVIDGVISNSIYRQEVAHERIMNIVESLRTYSQTDTRYDEILDTHELIDKTNLLVGMMYEKQGIILEKKLSSNKFKILGNSGKFQQILLILLSNAKDAVENIKFPIIKITTENLKNNLVITVLDNGIGIPKEIRNDIFNSFYTTKKTEKGIGIGLSILKTIVNEMNGVIKLDSEINMGSTFSLIFPITNLELNNEQIEKDNLKTTSLVHLAISGKVLVVDDDEGIRKLLVDYLEDMGLEVETANDGNIALEKVRNTKYDYICTDMTMPRMSGDEFIKAAKLLPNGDTKYCVITGGVTASYSAEKEKLIKDIVDAYIYKPFTHQRIFNALTGGKS
jgi:signal transduction histidine kinase/ActR/RegA family two-component response regulator